MARRIVPIFLPNQGCPHRCIFCNQRIAAGIHRERPTRCDFESAIAVYLGASSDRVSGQFNPLPDNEVQIAFYGSNFTGIPFDDQIDLLQLSGDYVEKGVVDSIRISTRPDFIDRRRLDLLKQFPVKTVEIGVQSMDDSVLTQCKRGHTADDSRRSFELLKAYGFETGVHLMAGLPGEDRKSFECSVEQIENLKPDVARIHPTLVFKDTELAAMFRAGNYRPLELDEAIDYCRYALSRFRSAGMSVIRIGLQTTAEMLEDGAILAGPFHPAFRALVEGAVFHDMAYRLFEIAQIEKSNKNESVFFCFSQRPLFLQGPWKPQPACIEKVLWRGSECVS